jgi:hypothetical protein
MDTCQNLIRILLDDQDITNLLIMMNIEIMFKCHMSPWATVVEQYKCMKYKFILYILSTYILLYATTSHVQLVLCNYGV